MVKIEIMNSIHNIKKYKKKRQYLRNNSTKAEKLLWDKIKHSQLGHKFRRQHSIKQYIVDFYCSELNLIIEVDGDVHDYKKQREKDWIREKYLEKLNFRIVRFSNYQIIMEIDKVLEKLKIMCNQLS